MRPAHVVEIVTPKKFMLNGLWFGPKDAQCVIVWVHGLGSSAFTKSHIIDELVDKHTAVLTFNNRGHDKISSVSSGRNKRIRGGSAHEIFTDCVDDIEGTVRYAKQQGAQSIILAGHSTGSQKSVYWAAKKGKGVDGIVLLAPMSDYAATVMLDGKKKIARAMSYARKLLKKDRPHELLPESVWDWSLMADAQRFISLYSGISEEEIFTYWESARKPKTLLSVKIPMLVVLAEKDEYADRSAPEIAAWFAEHLRSSSAVTIIPKVDHGFKGGEQVIVDRINSWASISMKATS